MAGRHLAQCRAWAQTPGVSPVTRTHPCMAGRLGPAAAGPQGTGARQRLALQPKHEVPRGVGTPPARPRG